MSSSCLLAQVWDEIYRDLKNATTSEKPRLYNQLSKSYLYTHPDKALKYANQALKIAQSLGDKVEEAEAYNNLGMGNYFLSDYDKLLKNYKRALSAFIELGEDNRASGLAATYYRLRQSQKSLENYRLSLQFYESANEIQRVIETRRKIGDVYKNLGNYKMALSQYLEAFYQIGEEENVDEAIILMGNIGEMWYLQEEYEKSLEWYKQLKFLLERVGDQQGRAAVLNNIAGNHYFLKQLNQAFATYEAALTLQKRKNDHYGAAMTLLNLARIERELGVLSKALTKHEQSIALAKVVNARELLRENYQELSTIFGLKGDYKEALKYEKLCSGLSEALAMEEDVTRFVNTMAIFELDEKRKENDILMAKNENFRLKLEKESLTRWRLSFGFTIFLIIILSFFIYYRYYLKREENRNLEVRIKAALRKQEEQQQIIVHQASLNTLGELAAGIAHEINQPIQNISLSAESIRFELEEKVLDRGYLNKSVDEIFEDILRVREIVDHIRIFSSGQKEQVFEAFNINDCVKGAVSMIGSQYAKRGIMLKTELTTSLGEVMGNPHKLEQVIHNFLSNAKDAVEERKIKEGNLVMVVGVRTYVLGEDLVLEVADNGTGIAVNRQTEIFLPFVTSKLLGKGTGLGLSISYRLVKELGGRIEVVSEINQGTKMQVFLPPVK